MSIEVKQLIIRTKVKDEPASVTQAITSEAELEQKLAQIKDELTRQVERMVEQKIRKTWEV